MTFFSLRGLHSVYTCLEKLPNDDPCSIYDILYRRKQAQIIGVVPSLHYMWVFPSRVLGCVVVITAPWRLRPCAGRSERVRIECDLHYVISAPASSLARHHHACFARLTPQLPCSNTIRPAVHFPTTQRPCSAEATE